MCVVKPKINASSMSRIVHHRDGNENLSRSEKVLINSWQRNVRQAMQARDEDVSQSGLYMRWAETRLKHSSLSIS